jgi:rhodanese-related sulfurtransferase
MLATAQTDIAPLMTEGAPGDTPQGSDLQRDLHSVFSPQRPRVPRATTFPSPARCRRTKRGRWLRRGHALLIDVRTSEEYKYVGHVPGTPLVQWQTGPALTKNPRFARELAGKAGKNDLVLLICRSGKRSAAAAEAATRAGFTRVFNVLEGFEGEITSDGQRGATGGWRYHGLPWVQD